MRFRLFLAMGRTPLDLGLNMDHSEQLVKSGIIAPGPFVLDLFKPCGQGPPPVIWRRSMIGYVTIGAKDSETSGKFYDAFFGAFGHERKFADGGWIGYGPSGGDTHGVYVCPPEDGKPAS